MRWTLVEYFAGRGNVSQMFRNEPGQYVCPYELLDHECMDFNSDPGFALLSLLLMPWVETCLQASHCFGASKRAGGIALDGPSVFELDTHKSREFVEIIYELLRGPFQRLCDVCKFNDLEALLKHIDRVRAQGPDHYALQHCRAWQLPLRAACWLWGCVPEPPTAFMAVQSCGCGSLAKRSNQVGVSLGLPELVLDGPPWREKPEEDNRLERQKGPGVCVGPRLMMCCSVVTCLGQRGLEEGAEEEAGYHDYASATIKINMAC